MAFTMLNADMSIIQKLADNPTETASELKAKFDEGGEAVKEYLNSVHLPELETFEQTFFSGGRFAIQPS